MARLKYGVSSTGSYFFVTSLVLLECVRTYAYFCTAHFVYSVWYKSGLLKRLRYKLSILDITLDWVDEQPSDTLVDIL